MKKTVRFLSLILAAALLVSAPAFQDGNSLTVHAAGTSGRKEMPDGDWLSDDFNQWLDNMKNFFEAGSAIVLGQTAGGLAAGINGGNIINGMLTGSLLNMDAAYYKQPTKIFDKVNQAYKGEPASSSTSEPNCYYYYQGGTDNSTSNTSNYHVYQDNSDYSTHTYNYQWYNPITNNYNYTNNYQYSYDYNTYYYQQTTENYQYDYYYIDNSTHMTYYIVQTDTSKDVPEVKEYIYDVYYELPDGRSSYNLRASDIWGSYYLYNTSKYDIVPEDDGTTLGLWHFDGNLEDSSYWNNSTGLSSSLQYSDGVFDIGKFIGNSVINLPLDNCSFNAGAPFTLEWRELHTQMPNTVSGRYHNTYDNMVLLDNYSYCSGCIRFGEFAHYALVYDGNSYSFFSNGIKQSVSLHSGNSNYVSNVYPANFDISNDILKIRGTHPVYFDTSVTSPSASVISRSLAYGHYNSIIDEMRLSKGVLYTSDFVPPAQPFDTNEVLVVPGNVIDNTVLFYTRYDYNGFRVGGVRPTYPADGYIYVNVEDDIVQSIQQYQVNKWVEIDAFLYDNGQLTDLHDYDLSGHKVVEPVEPDSGTGTGSGNNPGTGSGNNPGGSGGGDSGGDSGGGILGSIADFFGSIFGLIGEVISVLIGLLGDLVDLITSLITSLFDLLGVFEDFGGGFSDFLGAAFSFIPSDVWSLIGAGISAMVIIAVIKMLLE